MGLLDEFAGFAKTPEGQGLLSGLAGMAAGARRGTPWNNLGRGGLAGVIGYSNAQEQGRDNQIKEMQLAQMRQQQADSETLRNFDMSKFYQTPSQQAIENGGPTNENAAKIPNLSPRLDQQGMAAAMLASRNPVLMQQALGMLTKEDAPIALGDGGMLVTRSGDVLRENTKVAAPSDISRLLSERVALPPGSPLARVYDDAIKKLTTHAPGASATVVLPPAETEQQKTIGKEFGEVRGSLNKAAMQGQSTLKNLDRMEQLLNGVEGGKLSPLGADIASYGTSLGFNIDPKLGNKLASESLAIEMAMGYRQPGTGQMTDKDFENFRKIVPDLAKTAEGRKQITQTMRWKIERDTAIAKKAREYAKQHGGNLDDGFYDVVGEYYANNPLVSLRGNSNGPPPGAVRRITPGGR